MPYLPRGGDPPGTPRLPAAVPTVVSHGRGAVGPRGPCDEGHTQLTNSWLAACEARERTGSGTMPRNTVAATPRPTAVPVKMLGRTTSGPSGTGSLKNISTITRT